MGVDIFVIKEGSPVPGMWFKAFGQFLGKEIYGYGYTEVEALYSFIAQIDEAKIEAAQFESDYWEKRAYKTEELLYQLSEEKKILELENERLREIINEYTSLGLSKAESRNKFNIFSLSKAKKPS